MTRKVEITKDKIIRCTIDLLKNADINGITIKDIAEKADIGIGLVNYHFQSKENLISLAIRVFISEEIDKGGAIINQLDISPKDKLLASLKGYADFLALYPNIMKIHIINSFSSSVYGEEIKRSIAYYIPILQKIFPTKKNYELVIILQQIISVIMHTFLNSSEIEPFTHIDFFDDKQRDQLVVMLLENLLNKY